MGFGESLVIGCYLFIIWATLPSPQKELNDLAENRILDLLTESGEMSGREIFRTLVQENHIPKDNVLWRVVFYSLMWKLFEEDLVAYQDRPKKIHDIVVYERVYTRVWS